MAIESQPGSKQLYPALGRIRHMAGGKPDSACPAFRERQNGIPIGPRTLIERQYEDCTIAQSANGLRCNDDRSPRFPIA